GFLWFSLLFLAGLTSSISLAQPALAFLQDELGLSRRQAVVIFALGTFALCHFAVILLGRGVVDELDFWGGTFSLVVFATTEAILFAWVMGIDKAWTEMHAGSSIKLLGVYRFVMRYITPLFLLAILLAWTWQQAIPVFLLRGTSPENVPYLICTRFLLLLLLFGLYLMAQRVWSKKGKETA
ncbi:MAG TPA: sodium:calcium symporter, partial [bacterium]|nr:sodium:calcium symporter [bacterium]